MPLDQQDRQATGYGADALLRRARTQRERVLRTLRRWEEQVDDLAGAQPTMHAFLSVVILVTVGTALLLGHTMSEILPSN